MSAHGRIGGAQAQLAVPCRDQAPADELVLDDGDHDMAVRRRDGAVDQHEVAVVDAGLAHRVAGDAHQEGGLRVPDEDVVQVQPRDAGLARPASRS